MKYIGKQEFFKTKRQFGQNFLIDEQVIDQIHNQINNLVKYDNHVLEIGPGLGALTDGLLENYSGRLSIIDIDKSIIDILNLKYRDKGVNIIHEDFLKFNFIQFRQTEKIVVVGNLPYNISSQILFRILENRDRVVAAVIMIQKEMAERVSSIFNKKAYGKLSVLVQTFFDVKFFMEVKNFSFSPVPTVDSAVIFFTKKENREPINFSTYNKFVTKIFLNKRKFINKDFREAIGRVLNKSVVKLRAESLTVDEILLLYKDWYCS